MQYITNTPAIIIIAKPAIAVPTKRMDGFERLIYASLMDGVLSIPAFLIISATSVSIPALEVAVPVLTLIKTDGENTDHPFRSLKNCPETIAAYKVLSVPVAAVFKYPEIINSVSSCVSGIKIEMISPILASIPK